MCIPLGPKIKGPSDEEIAAQERAVAAQERQANEARMAEQARRTQGKRDDLRDRRQKERISRTAKMMSVAFTPSGGAARSFFSPT